MNIILKVIIILCDLLCAVPNWIGGLIEKQLDKTP